MVVGGWMVGWLVVGERRGRLQPAQGWLGELLKAIVFDLYETLVTESGTQPPGVSSFALPLGCDRDAFNREWKSVRSAVTLGRVPFRQAIADISSALGVPADASVLDRLCADRRRMADVLAAVGGW